MTFRDWAGQQIRHHTQKTKQYKSEEIRAYHEGAQDAWHHALTLFERDQNQQHRERMAQLDCDIRPA